jgi:DNA repair exonuclease SbcCD nuclease subunit
MIFITGDTHGEIDHVKLNSNNFKEYNLNKSDYVIIAGDFGFIWRDDKTMKYWLKWLNEKPFTTLFVDGNHENFNLLNAYPVIEWNGGKVHKITDSIIHLMRGQIFTIDNKKFFTFGGGTSIDRSSRINYVSWWPEEMPNYSEFQEGLKNLDKNNWQVDYVISHTGPSKSIQKINADFRVDALSDYLQEVDNKLKYTRWFFGHYHVDKVINDKHYAVYYDKVLLK